MSIYPGDVILGRPSPLKAACVNFTCEPYSESKGTLVPIACVAMTSGFAAFWGYRLEVLLRRLCARMLVLRSVRSSNAYSVGRTVGNCSWHVEAHLLLDPQMQKVRAGTHKG